MLETGFFAFLNKSAKEYARVIEVKKEEKLKVKRSSTGNRPGNAKTEKKAKEYARVIEVKKEEKLKVKRSSTGNRPGNAKTEKKVQEQMLLRDQVIYLQSRVVLLEQKLLSHGISLPEEMLKDFNGISRREKRAVLPFDQVFKAEWEEQVQDLRLGLNRKNEEITKVRTEKEELNSRLKKFRLQNLRSNSFSRTKRSGKRKKKKKKKEDRRKRSSKKEKEEKEAKEKKEKEEREAKQAKQVELLQGEWTHSTRGMGSFRVHGTHVSFNSGLEMEIKLKKDGKITLRGWQFYEAKTQAIRWVKIGREWEHIFWVRGKWLDPKKEKKHRKELKRKERRDEIDSHTDLPTQIDETNYAEITAQLATPTVQPLQPVYQEPVGTMTGAPQTPPVRR
eukprot:symbB.v1.2.022282.t1/scaffold1972.1/size94142/5